MITASDIKMKALRKYPEYLRGVAAGQEFMPIEIICDKKASKSITEFEKEFKDICSLSKEVKGYGYTIEWKHVNSKLLGNQGLPSRIFFESAYDYERFLQKVVEVERFREDVKLIIGRFSVFHTWIEKYPLKVIENSGQWADLLKVLDYFYSNPNPQLYIRELPIEVHTKFIEQNKALLKELLDIVLAESVNYDEKDFEKRFGLRYVEPMIRMRVFDAAIADSFFSGVDEIAIPLSRFQKLNLPITKVFVVENKVNFLAFPIVENSIVIWGSGYGVSSLKDSDMLKSAKLYYWGDLDSQGFEILSQFRGYFPQTESLLMDRETFDKYFEKDSGTASRVFVSLNLTNEETMLYDYIKEKNYRLEQEKIPQGYLLEKIKVLL